MFAVDGHGACRIIMEIDMRKKTVFRLPKLIRVTTSIASTLFLYQFFTVISLFRGNSKSMEGPDLHHEYISCTSTLDIPKLTDEERQFLLFTAPKSFAEVPENLMIWSSMLKGIGHLIIFSNDARTRLASANRGISTMCVEHTIDGFPRFDLMMTKMEQVQPDGFVAFTNSDIEITGPGMDAIVSSLKWLDTKSLELVLPHTFSRPSHKTGKSTKFWFAALNRWDDQNGQRKNHDIGGYDLWAWNVHPNGPSLLPFGIPPFRFPLGTYGNWLLDVVNKAWTRNVVDMTDVAVLLHKEHSRKNYYEMSVTPNSGYGLNKLLGFSFSESNITHINHDGTVLEAPYFVTRNNNEFVLNKREYFSSGVKSAHGQNEEASNILRNVVPPLSAHFPDFHLRKLLRARSTENGYVLLMSFTLGHRNYLLNLICNLDRVGKSSDHMIIAALDQGAYEWGVRRGLPVFLPKSIRDDQNHSGFEYGTSEFKSVTKMKSRATLEVLSVGYSVVYTDIDITWFEDPLSSLRPYMNEEVGLTIQSNAPYHSKPGEKIRPHYSVGAVESEPTSNGYERFNSGLYVAPYSELMLLAFSEIVEQARYGTQSEQPYFYHVLCTTRWSSIVGSNGCEFRPRQPLPEWPPGQSFAEYLPVWTLDRFEHPNGAVMLGPDPCNIYCLGVTAFENLSHKKVVSAHNNWIVNKNDAKMLRQKQKGWWYIEEESCSYMSSKNQYVVPNVDKR